MIVLFLGAQHSYAEEENSIFETCEKDFLGSLSCLAKQKYLDQQEFELVNKELNVSRPIFTDKYYGVGLSTFLKNENIFVSESFAEFNSFSALSKINYIPKTRLEAGVGSKDDLLHQRGIQIQINRELISSGTLILSDTGHDIPLAAQLLKNEELMAQAFFYLPEPIFKSSGTNERLLQQAQDWAQDINYYQSKTKNKTPGVIFVGLEGHRRSYEGSFLYKIPTQKLPTNRELVKWGIKKIIYITEAHPNNPNVSRKVIPDISEYLKKINLPIDYLGVDCRRDSGC